jgi:hypothetical protein
MIDRLILRYQFTLDGQQESRTNVLKVAIKGDFLQLWITNGGEKYAQYRLSKEQAKQLVEFINANA